MKRNGFTLVELLVMLVVLAILMLIAIPNISGMIKNQKLNSMKNDMNSMIETTKIKANKNKSLNKPRSGECIVFSLSYLNDNDNITKGPNGGLYNQYDSLVLYTREGNKYKYYVRLIELYKNKYTGVSLIDGDNSKKLKNSDIGNVEELIGLNKDLSDSDSIAYLSSYESIATKCPNGIKGYFSSESEYVPETETDNYVSIEGANTWGNRLTATLVTSGTGSKTYQWYVNSNKSMTGGTAISGATDKSYVVSKNYIGKYIYVKVNVDDKELSDITDSTMNTTAKVAKKNKCDAPTDAQIVQTEAGKAEAKIIWTASEDVSSYQASMNHDSNFTTYVNGDPYNDVLASTGNRKVYVKGVCNTTYFSNESSDTVEVDTTVYSVNLTKGTGISSVSGAGNYVSGSQVNISATSSGAVFSHWADTNSGEVISDQTSYSATINENWAYTANTKGSGVITYNNNGGTGCTTKTVNYNSTYGTLCTPTRTGYRFGGWYSNAEGTGNAISTSTKMTGDVVIYAKWTANNYTIIYNGNGNTGGSTAYSSHTYDVTKQLTSNGYTKTGYKFMGWNTKADGTGSSYSNNAYVINLAGYTQNNDSITLYAQWIGAVNIGYNNSNTGVNCTDTQCMLDYLAGRLT